MKKLLTIVLSCLLALFCLVGCNENKYTVTVTKNIGQAGEVVGVGVYDVGETVTLTATTNTGYVFLGWYEGEEFLSSETTYVFDVEKTVAITAKWEALFYAVTVTKNIDHAGTATGAGSYAYGTTVALVATDNEGYYFWAWYKDGVKYSESQTITITVTQDETYEARWYKNSDGNEWSGLV